MSHTLFFGCLVSVALTAPLAADEIVLECDRDNTMYSEGQLSNGAGDHIFCGKNGANDLRRLLVRFDIAAHVPAGATIESARLDMNMSRSQTGPWDYSMHRVLADWGEAGSDAAGGEGGGDTAEIGDVTWTHRFYDSVMWKNDGGDFEPTPSVVLTVNSEGPYSFGPTDATRDDVQLWLDQPEINFGWILVEPTTPMFITSTKRFDSRTIDEVELRPKLVITFTPGGVFGDLTGDGFVNGADLAVLLTNWGACDDCESSCPGDLNDTCGVDGADLAILLTNWS